MAGGLVRLPHLDGRWLRCADDRDGLLQQAIRCRKRVKREYAGLGAPPSIAWPPAKSASPFGSGQDHASRPGSPHFATVSPVSPESMAERMGRWMALEHEAEPEWLQVRRGILEVPVSGGGKDLRR